MSSCCPINGAVGATKDFATNNFAAKSGTVCKLCVSDLTVTNVINVPNLICANYPLTTTGAPNNCVELLPGFCGSIVQYVNGAWGIYRSPGTTEITVGDPGDGVAPGANFRTVTDALGDALDTNCRFIRVTSNTVEGAINLPGPVYIYVDPGVTWSPTSINTNGFPLALRGSGQSSNAVISGTINGISSVTVMDMSLTLQQFVGASGAVLIRDAFLTSINGTTATQLFDTLDDVQVSDTTITLQFTLLSTSTTTMRLTRVILNATFDLAGINPTANGETGGRVFLSNTTLLEINGLTYNGNFGDLVLANGYVTDANDISNADIGGSLTIRVANIGPAYPVTVGTFQDPTVANPYPAQYLQLPLREITNFKDGRFISDESPLYNSDALARTWRNLNITNAQIEWLMLPCFNGPNTAVVNCHFSQIRMTVGSGSVGLPNGYRQKIGAVFACSNLTDIFIPQQVIDNALPVETTFFFNNAVRTVDCRIENFSCGSIIPVADHIYITNLTALDFYTSGSNSTYCTYTNCRVRNIGDGANPITQFWANMTACRVSNMVVDNNAWINISNDNVFDNMIIGNFLKITACSRNNWSNIRCGYLWTPGPQLPVQNFLTSLYSPQSASAGNQTNSSSSFFENFSNIVVLNNLDFTYEQCKIENLYCRGALIISGNRNHFSNVTVDTSLSAGGFLSIEGDLNKIESLRCIRGPIYSVAIRGNQNQMTDWVIPGCTLGGVQANIQTFRVTGCMNKFENLQLGESIRIPIQSYDVVGGTIVVNNNNPTVFGGIGVDNPGFLYQNNAPPVMPPTVPSTSSWSNLFQPGNCICVGSQQDSKNIDTVELSVISTIAGAGTITINTTFPTGFPAGLAPNILYIFVPNPLDTYAFGNIDYTQTALDTANIGGGGSIEFGGNNNQYTNVQIITKRNTISRVQRVFPPDPVPPDFNLFGAWVDVVVTGMFNRFTNLWLYRDPRNYAFSLTYPAGPVYSPASISFGNQNLLIAGSNNTFHNSKVGPSCPIGSAAPTIGQETFITPVSGAGAPVGPGAYTGQYYVNTTTNPRDIYYWNGGAWILARFKASTTLGNNKLIGCWARNAALTYPGGFAASTPTYVSGLNDVFS